MYRSVSFWVQPQTDNLWKLIADDEPLPKKFLNGAITAAHAGGEDGRKHKKPDSEAEANGLCA